MVHRRVGNLRMYQRRRKYVVINQGAVDNIGDAQSLSLTLWLSDVRLLLGPRPSPSGTRARLHPVPVYSSAPRATPANRRVRWQLALRSGLVVSFMFLQNY